MFAHGLDTEYSRATAFQWYLMSFLAGNVNAGGFLACERFVTHVTGFVTLAGIDFVTDKWAVALGMLTAPGFYLGGVIIAAWFTAHRSNRGLVPNYSATMGLVALCLFMAAVIGALDGFGEFGSGFYLQHDYLFLALLCTAAGLQNAAISTSSGSTVRTTHLTGITTDLGIGLVAAFSARRDSEKYRRLVKKNRQRLGTIFAFFVGGAVGAALYLRIHYLGFFLPIAIAGYAAYLGKVHQNENASHKR